MQACMIESKLHRWLLEPTHRKQSRQTWCKYSKITISRRKNDSFRFQLYIEEGLRRSQGSLELSSTPKGYNRRLNSISMPLMRDQKVMIRMSGWMR